MSRIPATALAVPLLGALLAASLAAPLAAQEARPISQGQTLSSTLASDSEHDYTISLAADWFAYGDVDQIDVDVVVTVLGPDGEPVARFDGPSRGPESFQFSTEDEGEHTIRVTPFENQEGDYQITLTLTEPVASDPAKRVDQLLVRYRGYDTPGAVVGVVKEGEVVLEKAYGMANLEYGVPHRVDTPTNIGSVTKQFTAMAVLLLQNDGELSLDDDIREYIPELPDFGETVTLKNVLNHATGYREIYNFLPMAGRDGEDRIDRDEAIRIIQRQPELQASPDTEFNYNNTGFILMGEVVERVSGMPFPEFIKTRIFWPLGMDDTRMKYVQGEIIPGASRGYVPAEDGGWRGVRDLAASAGAGGIYTTFPDMTRWMANYRDGTVGGPEASRAITTPNVLADGDTTNYGLGLGITEVRGLKVYTHTGGDVAHRTYFAYFPEIDGGLFMSSNAASFGSGMGNIAGDITDLFFEEHMEPDEEAEEDVAEEEAEEAGEASMPEERMEAIVGHWILVRSRLPAEFTLEDEVLYAEPQGQPRFQLHATSDSSLAITQPAVEIFFHFTGDESVDSATFVQTQPTPMVRMEPEPLTVDVVRALEGRYYSRELELWVEIRQAQSEEGGGEGEAATDEPMEEDVRAGEPGESDDVRLELLRLRGEPITLTRREGLIFGGSFPFGEVEFVRASNWDVTGLLAGNGRTKGVLFERR